MKYERFEDLPVWKDAIKLAVEIYALVRRLEFRGHGSLRDQVERAAVSVSSNIAEGFERGTTQENLTFLYIARGSVAEVRSLLNFMERLPDLHDLKSHISNLKSLSESISRQLRAFTDYLQNSKIQGQRHLTEELLRAKQAARSRAEFLEYLREVQERARPEFAEFPEGETV